MTDTRGLNDFGINQATWSGLQQAQAAGTVQQIASIESVDARDYDKNIAFFIDRGYDVVITSGVGLRDATLRSADLWPDSVFIGMNQTDDESRPNFIPVTFAEDQMGFFAGALAAHLTRTRLIGAICETSGIDAMWRYCEGFRAGAAFVDDSVRILVTYRDDGDSERLFIDPEWGYATAQGLVQRGADVIFAAGGETAVGALRAAAEAKVRALGAERDQGAALGDEGAGVVTSVLGRASLTIQELMRRIQAGNLADAEGSPVGYIPFDEVVQSSLLMEMDELLLKLASGEVKTNVTAKRP